jgi:hypothetical protein
MSTLLELLLELRFSCSDERVETITKDVRMSSLKCFRESRRKG